MTMAAAQAQALAALRREVAKVAGRPVILSAQPGRAGPGSVPGPAGLPPMRPSGWVFTPASGLCAYARTAAEARQVAASGPGTLPEAVQDVHDLPAAAGTGGLFVGEVALVTGAASGIGQACAEALLVQGAAVVGLDLNPAIVEMFDGPGYLGLQVDLTDEARVVEAVGIAARAFGGLDMLVLNAGVFPSGCDISALSLADWQRVMRINVDANLVMLRECYPILKLAPKFGRVVVNGSRNVPAPGPGAAAYSCSKAAITQLARVAALEWARDGIRVNVFHAHAVMDTGIWTPEVLSNRAAHYGMTVEQYKANNLLHTEVLSADVAALVVALCGPAFAKTTGAQLPIDGGNDRVI